MKLLISNKELKKLKSTDSVPVECCVCHNTFYPRKDNVIRILRGLSKKPSTYCSSKCFNSTRSKKHIINCKQCNKEFEKEHSQIKKHPNSFCSRSCATKYNNAHKTKGTRRSKLEQWIELKLKEFYPELEILFNSKEIIKSELDIYIPSLRLAFELNGIFHYEPIYGKDKFNKIQSNDTNKFQKCQKHNISLCILDTSGQKYFKPSTSTKYLNIITAIIEKPR